MKTLMLIALCLVLCACAPKVVTKTDYCTPYKPIIPNSIDAMTKTTSDQILAYDCQGYRLNCWDPPGIAVACKGITGK